MPSNANQIGDALQAFFAVWRWFMQPEVASIATFLGLAFSFLAFTNIRRVRRDFVGAVRIPELHGTLKNNATTINKLMLSYPSSEHALVIELRKCRANLGNLRGKLAGRRTKSVRTISITIENAIASFVGQSPPRAFAGVQDIHGQLNELIQAISNYLEDQKWRTRDVG